MKSQIVELRSKKVLGFPKLMQGTITDVVVLFYEKSKGQVVNGECSDIHLGDNYIEWNMSNFKDFNGTIKLSNE
jgi:hypothetical protein